MTWWPPSCWPASAATCSSWPGCRCRRGCSSAPSVERVADLIPVALLAALVAVQVFAPRATTLVLDARARRARASPWWLLLLRAPFLVVVVRRGPHAALLRL